MISNLSDKCNDDLGKTVLSVDYVTFEQLRSVSPAVLD